MQTRVKELRERKKMSQLNLAVRIGSSQNMISKIEKGESDPSGSLLLEMSELFGVSVDYILGRSGEKFTAERKTKLLRLAEENQEYVEKYGRLSEASKTAVNTVMDRMLEIERRK